MQIEPTSKERLEFQKIVQDIKKVLNPACAPASVLLAGSGAKDTWLPGKYDLDFFIVYPYEKYKEKSGELSLLLQKSLEKIFPSNSLIRLHGSRDYFQVKYQDHLIEIVPILQINEAKEAKNITDISPLHAKWVNEKAVNLKTDIRKAKLFCKASQVYGAESYIGGLSGYVLEILIVFYGSFEKLLKESLKWKEGQIIDVSKYYKKGQVRFNLNVSKLQSPLIVIDPVDKLRNASAALTIEKFKQFQKYAKDYLRAPSEDFFKEKVLDKKEILKNKNSVWIDVSLPIEKIDIAGAKLNKVQEFINQSLVPFEVKKSGWVWNNNGASLYFVCKKNILPEHYLQKGPPIDFAEAVKDFKKKHKQVTEVQGRLIAKVSYPERDLLLLVRKLFTNKYILEKISRVEKIESS